MPNYLLKERFNSYGFLVELVISKMMRWIYVYTGSGVKGIRVLKCALVPQKDRIRRTWIATRMGVLRALYRVYTIRVRHDPYITGRSSRIATRY
jgi:hypothetical protein